MATLSADVKVFIVSRLACYDTPQVVADAVKEQFGFTIDRRQVQTYDPTALGRKPSKKLVAVFNATRKRFEENIDEIPIAKKSVRLRRYQRMADAAEKLGAYQVAKEMLEVAAKEVGNVLTNRREVTGAGGGPIQTQETGLSREDMDARLRTLIDRAHSVVSSSPTPNASQAGPTPVAQPITTSAQP